MGKKSRDYAKHYLHWGEISFLIDNWSNWQPPAVDVVRFPGQGSDHEAIGQASGALRRRVLLPQVPEEQHGVLLLRPLHRAPVLEPRDPDGAEHELAQHQDAHDAVVSVVLRVPGPVLDLVEAGLVALLQCSAAEPGGHVDLVVAELQSFALSSDLKGW